MKNADASAMPLGSEEMSDRFYEGIGIETGLTKREMFAMHAMQGAWYELTDCNKPVHYQYAAESCVKMADALLAQLEESGDE